MAEEALAASPASLVAEQEPWGIPSGALPIARPESFFVFFLFYISSGLWPPPEMGEAFSQTVLYSDASLRLLIGVDTGQEPPEAGSEPPEAGSVLPVAVMTRVWRAVAGVHRRPRLAVLESSCHAIAFQPVLSAFFKR